MSRWPRIVLLADLVDPERPITYGIVQPGPHVPDGVPYVRVVDMIDGTVRTDALRRTSPEIAKSYRRSSLHTGDLLVSIRGHVGRAALVPQDVAGANLTQDTARIAVSSLADARYIRRAIESPLITRWLAAHTKGVAVRGVNLGDLRQLPIPLPPLPEQRRIADILDKADAIRRKRKEAIALTEQLLRSTFLEMFGDPVTNPKGWPVKPLGEVCEVAGGLQVTSSRSNHPLSLPYLRVANVYRDRLDLREIKEIRLTEPEAERTVLRDGDVLIVEGHGNPEELGRAAVWLAEIPRCTHQNHLIRARANTRHILPAFLSYFLNSPSGRQQMLRFGKTTSGLNTISTNNVRSVRLLVPPLSVQERFVLVVNTTRKLAAKIEEARGHSRALFEALVGRAFGKS